MHPTCTTSFFVCFLFVCVVGLSYASSATPIRIGIARDSTAYALWDNQLYDGLMTWKHLVDQKQGGINVRGVIRPVDVVTIDTATWQARSGIANATLDPSAAATAYHFLHNDSNVDVFFGCYNTGRMLAVQPVATKYDKLLLSQGAGGDALWKSGAKTFFSSTLPVSKGIYSTLDLLLAKGAKTFAMLAKSDASPLQAIQLARTYIISKGGNVTYFGNYSYFGAEGVRELTAVIRTIQPIEHDVFFYGGTPEDLSSLGTVFKVLTYTPKAAAFANTVQSDVAKVNKMEELADGWMFYTAWEPWWEIGDASKGALGYGPDFTAAFKARNGYTPLFLNAGTAVMGVVLEAALNATNGNTSGAAIREAILGLPVLDTFYGHMKFDGTGLSTAKDVGICVYENNGEPRLISIGTDKKSEFTYPVVWPWSPKPTVAPPKAKNNTPVIAGVAGGVGGFLLIVGALVAYFTHHRRREAMKVLAEAKEGEKKNYKIEYKELRFDRLIGAGNFGQVYAGEYRGADVAIKKLKHKLVSKQAISEFVSEVSVMVGLRHPNILLFMGACNEPPNLCLVTEYMPLGNLYDVLHESVHLPPALIMSMALDITKGLLFIHSAGMLHRDFKSPNVLVDKRWNLKISDFGLTCLKSNNDDMQQVSIPWTAPEVFRQEPYTEKSDIYSLGIIFWELMSRKMPYEDTSPAAIAPNVMAGKRLKINVDWPEEMRRLIACCWDGNQSVRPTVAEIRKIVEGMNPGAMTTTDAYATHSTTDLKKSKVLPSGDVFLVSLRVHHAIEIWEWQPLVMMNALILMSKMFRKAATVRGGYAVNLDEDHYDRMLFAFTNVHDALNFCLDGQVNLLKIEWPATLCDHPETAKENSGYTTDLLWNGLRVKMGINYGTPNFISGADKSGYEGPVVDLAEGLAALADRGQILITDKVVNSIIVKDKLNQHILTQLGRHKIEQTLSSEMLYEITPTALQKRVFRTLGGPNSINTPRIDLSKTGRWLVKFNELTIMEPIGAGSFGEVHRAEYKGQTVAVKLFLQQKLQNKVRLELHAEGVTLSQLEHPNILKFIGICAKQPNMCLVTEYMAHGNLKQILMDGSIDLPWTKRIAFARDIAQGMKYLHVNNIIHRDLKPSNILVDADWTVKIADFGLSRIKTTNQTMTQCGTVSWIAPEIFNGDKYTEKADVYAFAIVMWEMLTRQEVWKGQHSMRITTQVQAGQRPKFTLSPVVPNVISTSYVNLMNQCWDQDPEQRPSFSSCVATLDQIATSLGGGVETIV